MTQNTRTTPPSRRPMHKTASPRTKQLDVRAVSATTAGTPNRQMRILTPPWHQAILAWMTPETEHRALGSMHSTREDNLQSKRPDTLKAQAFERMRYHFQTATWVAVGLLTSLSMATTIASRLSGGLSLNYTELQGPVFRGGFAPQTQSTNGLLTAVTFNLRYGTQAEEAIE